MADNLIQEGLPATGPEDRAGPQISIVIPAFKPDFLEQALVSLTKQTDQNFEVLVADDGSLADLRGICMAFSERLMLNYHRFERNLGATNLVGHWTRAVDAASHDWIWLIGDDDELESGCVAAMRKALADEPTWPGLWHVDVLQIDAKGDVEGACPPYPLHLSVSAFISARCAGKLSSFACEYVFQKATLRERGGFVSFPLAWCSDDATWSRLAGPYGIRTVRAPNAKARWRRSTRNISGGGAGLNAQKLQARMQYVEWLTKGENCNSLGLDDSTIEKLRPALWAWFLSGLHSSRAQIGVVDVWHVGRRIGRHVRGSLIKAIYELLRCRRWIAASMRRDLKQRAQKRPQQR